MNTEPTLTDDLKSLRAHYDQLALLHGDSPAAVQQSSVESQERRLRVLTEIGPLANTKVLDFGCGAGRMLDLLKREQGFAGENYTGYDISTELLSLGRSKHPEAYFGMRDIFQQGMDNEFDYIFISGVFNNLIRDNELFIHKTLEILYPCARKGLAFNVLSHYVDFKDEGLYYADPCRLFDYCKEKLSPAVTVRHDYQIKDTLPPFECSFYIYSCGHKPRMKLET